MIHSYPWYPADWRGSQEVVSLTAEQRDVYRNLLDACWIDGSLPQNCTVLQRLSMADAAEWQRSWPKVRRLFRVKNRRLHHPKVDEKRPQLIEWHEQKREAGKRSAEVRRTGVTTKRERAFNGRSTDVQRTFQPSSTSTYKDIKESVVHTTEHCAENADPPHAKTTAGFDRAWEAYCSTGKPVNERDRMDAAREWISQGCDDCAESVLAELGDYLESCADLVRNREYRKIKALDRWLSRTPWTRRQAVDSQPGSAGPSETCLLCGGAGWLPKTNAPEEPVVLDGGAALDAWAQWKLKHTAACKCAWQAAAIGEVVNV